MCVSMCVCVYIYIYFYLFIYVGACRGICLMCMYMCDECVDGMCMCMFILFMCPSPPVDVVGWGETWEGRGGL